MIGFFSRHEAATLLILGLLTITVGIAPVTFLSDNTNASDVPTDVAETSQNTYDNEPTNSQLGNGEKEDLRDSWGYSTDSGEWVDYRDLLSPYREYATDVKTKETRFFKDVGNGLFVDYEIQGNKVRVFLTIGSYSFISYTFEDSSYQALVIPDTQVSNQYGEPALPYRSVFFSIPNSIDLSTLRISSRDTTTLRGLNIIPGPKPLAVGTEELGYEEIFANPSSYATNYYSPVDQVGFQIVNSGNMQVLLLRVYPLQFNPLSHQGLLTTQMNIEITFSDPISPDTFIENPNAPNPTPSVGEDYVIIADSSFSDALQYFIDWKTSIGFNVSLMTVQDILSDYSGRDDPEKVRNFIKDAYLTNGSIYFFLVGDGDVVPVREVEDPYNAGMGLDNGTEPSDLYYECLDGDWDQNGNDIFGESDDNVDLFPEVMLGRIPVQTPSEAREVCASLIRLESDPVPGEWMDNFLLLANDCFETGDGPTMVEGYLNQQFLYDSFFDVTRLYSSDSSLSNTAVIDAINNGAIIVDFFDHGAYNVWSGALSSTEASNLQNGNMSLFAFAMACETAAFDYEAGEPTIAEAFFRNSDGGASIYIGATRIAWAGYHCFDGFHHRFWHNFLPDAINERIASPKAAFHAALYEMATVFDTSVYSTLETIYQAIYFGDPAMNLYWKHNVTVETNSAEPSETVNLDGTCSLLVSNAAIVDSVNVKIADPFGEVAYSDMVATNSEGIYSLSFLASDCPGVYTVETTINSPFLSTEISRFNVGSANVAVQLDSNPVYHTFLDFSGTSSVDGTGNATMVDAQGTVLETKTFIVSGGSFTDSLNVTAFGRLKLVIQVDGASFDGGTFIDFKVSRGDILVMNYASGGSNPAYPGGWADSNAGDSSNAGDYYRALSNEYDVTLFFTIYEYTPSLEYLLSFEVVVISTGDNYGMPLMSSECYMLDTLQAYHDSGGEVLYEGGAFLQAIYASIPHATANLMHVDYSDSYSNQGGAYIMPTGHPVTSGLPASIQLTGELDSPLIDSFTVTNGSTEVSDYSGIAAGTAIAALSPSGELGGVVVIGFSIDGIADVDQRSRLITNAIEFLIYPTLIVDISDDAMRSGTSEHVNIFVDDAATATPVYDATVEFIGCGVSETNTSKADGTCSVLLEPISPGIIEISVSKRGYINYTSKIIVYELPEIAISTSPDYLVRDEAQNLLITATDFYELSPIEGALIEIAGDGIADSGLTNSSGEVEFVVTPFAPGVIEVYANLSGYVNATDYIGVLLVVLVLPGLGTEYSNYCLWDDLMLNWDSFGTIPLLIDYTSMTMPFDFDDINAIGPDVLVWDYQLNEYTTSQLDAIKAYTQLGHGLLACGGTLIHNVGEMATFLGISDSITMTSTFDTGYEVSELSAVDTEHPLMVNLPATFSTNLGYSFWPEGTEWDLSVLAGASYVALDSENKRGAIITFRGMVYCSFIPEYDSNVHDMQLVYNCLTWSKYEIPDHEVGVHLQTPIHLNPAESTTLNATVFNMGRNNETDVVLRLFIDGVEVDSLVIDELQNATSKTLEYPWTPMEEGDYNITAYVEPVPFEDIQGNNIMTRWIRVLEISLTGPAALFQENDPWGYSSIQEILDLWDISYDIYDADAMGMVDLAGYQKVIIASNQPGYFMDELYSSLSWFEDYVANGGTLEVHAATNSYWLNGLTPGGPEYIEYIGEYIDIVISNHPVLNEPNAITDAELDGWSSSVHGYLDNIPAGASEILETQSGYPVLIEFTLGFGSIITSTQTLEWAFGRENSRILENILLYVPESPTHDLAAYIDAPPRMNPNDSYLLEAIVFNRGLNTEYDVNLYLYIEGVEIDSLYISELTNGTSQSLTYLWQPSVEAIYNVTAYVEAAPLEEKLYNNKATQLVNVKELHDYHMMETEGNWLDAKTNGENIYLYGDDTYDSYDFEFTFPFYDSLYDHIYISSNGWLSFVTQDPWEYSPQPYPSVDPRYAYALAPYWADLQAEDNVYIWSTLEFLVVQYDNYYFLSGDLLGTFQIVFYNEGIIEFNYLEMFDTYYGTVGLNYGDGIYYNSISCAELEQTTESGLMFFYQLPEHEITVTLDSPSVIEPDKTTVLNATVTNIGLNNETDVNLKIYLDGLAVAETAIGQLNTGQDYPLQYVWTPIEEGIYNVTAYAAPVPGETFLTNNVVEKLVRVAVITLVSDFEDANQVFIGTGLWHLVDDSDPYGESHSPKHSMWYGQDETGNYNTGSPNHGSLISRPYYLDSNIDSLIFWSWYETEASGHDSDLKDVYVILPDNSWILIGYVSGSMYSWQEFSFDISSFADSIVRFAFQFNTLDQYDNYYRGWYIDDVSVIGSISPLDHDLGVVLDILGLAEVDCETEILATAINWGLDIEVSVTLALYIDGTLATSLSIPVIYPLEIHQISYAWTPTQEKDYNITAWVSIVVGETLQINNRDTQFIYASGERLFEIVQPTSGATVSGGLVFIDLEAAGPAPLETVYVYLNDEFILSFSAGYGEDFFVPIFHNGTNYIIIEGNWSDGAFSYANLTLNSVDVVPMIRPEVGDRVDWLFDLPEYYVTLNSTFTEEVGPFSWEIELVQTQYDNEGAIQSQTTQYQTMNILNGYGESGYWMRSNQFWLTGITTPSEIGDVGLFQNWNELLTIRDSGMWQDYPTWIMEHSVYPDIEFQALKQNGLLVNFYYTDAEVNYTLVYCDFMPNPDDTPPEWVTASSTLYFEYGQMINFQFQATDESGIDCWSMPSSTYFSLTRQGVLSSISMVPIGDFCIEITVTDLMGNNATRVFTICVRDTTGPIWTTTPTNQEIELGEDFEYVLAAWDLSGIHHWTVNDTTHFAVNSTGAVTNIIELPQGVYGLNITVYDIYGNYNSAIFALAVGESTTTETPPMVIVIGVIAIGVLAGIVAVMVIRKRSR